MREPGETWGGDALGELCAVCDLSTVGLDPSEVAAVELVHQRHGGSLYRIWQGKTSTILKWFADPDQAIEVRSYVLLQNLGVPTLPVLGRNENALVLEDLSIGLTWRLADKTDVERPETGVAVAQWYRALHSAGRKLFTGGASPPSFLRREIDTLNPQSVLEIGSSLGLAHDPVWELAADHIEAIKRAVRSLPETLNYNDFDWTNLALSRRRTPSLGAIVFDYHLLGMGIRYSDCRNAVGGLGDRAAAAFWEAYGFVDEQEQLLDGPTAILYGLLVAVRRPAFPTWAQDLLHAVRSRELETSFRLALETLR